MKVKKTRTHKDLTKAQMREISMMQAMSPISLISSYCRDYGLSRREVYKVLDRSCIESVISLNMVEKMRMNSIFERDSLDGREFRSVEHVNRHFDRLLRKRDRYLPSNKECVELVHSFIDYPEVPMNPFIFVDEQYISEALFKRILLHTVKHHLLSKSEYEVLITKRRQELLHLALSENITDEY